MTALMMEPGPTQIDSRVVQAMCRPAIYHLDPEFIGVLDDACGLLQAVFGTAGEVVVVPATGRGSIEAVLTSAFGPDDRILVPSNGVFGQMVAAIGRALGRDIVELPVEAGAQLDLDALVAAAREHPPAAIAVVHCETSTGMLNPIREVAEIAREHGSLVLVDAIASAGGSPVRMEEWGIDFAVAAGQKALGALPGISAVGVSERGRARLQAVGAGTGARYFNLDRWWGMWLPTERGGRLQFGYRRLPWTTATHSVLALEAACRIVVEEEGLPARLARHHAAGRAFRAAIESMGLQLLAPPGLEADTVTAFFPPDGIDARDVTKALHANHDIKVAGGLEALAGRIVRVGHMAETARPVPLQTTLGALALELRRAGVKVGEEFAEVFASTWQERIGAAR